MKSLFRILLAVVGLVASNAFAADAGKLTVTWFEMKAHGLATLLETPSGKVYLIDTGADDKKQDYNTARDTVAPYLKAKGIAKIDGIAISHPHGDHFGGLEWWLMNWPVKQVVDSGYEGRGLGNGYRKLRELAKERGAEYLAVTAGQKLKWDKDLSVEVLSPPKAFLETSSDPKVTEDSALVNGNSMVLRVKHGENVFLFPGDSYGMGQQYMMTNTPPAKLRATVVTAPHHGFSTDPNFAEATHPKIVVVSCLPDYPQKPVRSPAALAASIYGVYGAKTYATPWHGNVSITSDGKTVSVKTEREYTPPPAKP
jgi:competence protein ComEC